MSTITTCHSIGEIPEPDELIELIQKQLETYRSDTSVEPIKNALNNALKEESRSVFFLWHDYKNRLGAFAFANVCSGLESGADYLWINELFVDEMFRNRGVATEILRYIDDWSKENQIVYISCVTGDGNKEAKSLYQKSGFTLSPSLWVDKNV